MNVRSIPIPIAEAESKLSELGDPVCPGEGFVITCHQAEIARFVPAQRPSRKDVGDAIAQMREGRAGRPATAAELEDWKQEGRR
jgi:antitoxin (DNA-binding transcriptional repressor) of toxin-antitoxin stability system